MLNTKIPHPFGKVDLREEECYSSIEQFYYLVATKLGYKPDEVTYDCRKICVTKPVMDKIFAFYMEERKLSKGVISQGWLGFGPKANLPGEDYAAEVEKDFVSEAKL